jgi:hypothetical protein
MVYFFLLFVCFFIDASQQQFFLTLTDKLEKQHEVGLDTEDLKFFPMLQRGFAYNKKSVLEWKYGELSYEIFENFLQPLCKELKTVGDLRTMVPVKEITSSQNLLADTKRVIEWFYQKNHPVDDVIQAYRAADFLEMPFAIRRGFVNYLYDKGVAGQVVEAEDLAENRLGLLISNKEINKNIELSISADDFCDKKASFEKEQIRFFDVDYFCEWVNSLQQPIDVSKKKHKTIKDPIYFDFSNNKIQSIDFVKLGNCFRNNKNIRYSIFNVRINLLGAGLVSLFFVISNGPFNKAF